MQELHLDAPSAPKAGTTLVVFGDQDRDVYARAYFDESYVKEELPQGLWHTDDSDAPLSNPETRYYVRMNSVTQKVKVRKCPECCWALRESPPTDASVTTGRNASSRGGPSEAKRP